MRPAVMTPIQKASVFTQTDVAWVGAQSVTRRQSPTAFITRGTVPSVS